jgi:probable rRNA maturation factor
MPTTATRAKARPEKPARLAVQRAVRAAPPARLLARFARAAAARGMTVTLRVVGAAEGRRLNRAFRRRDYATDVLAFDYGGCAGDLALCHPVIARAAREARRSLAAHYAHVIVHGMLHLRGYRHARAREAARMRRAETRILRRLGFRDPYALE